MITALLTIDADVFYRAPDGHVYTQSVATYDDYWIIPRQNFDQLVVVTRLKNITNIDSSWRLADGDGVVFRTVPFYKGLRQYIINYHSIRNAISKALEECDVLLCNGPGTLSGVGISLATKMNKLYALDVLGDPFDVYAVGVIKHPLRPFLHWLRPRQLRRWCKGACAVNYVTKYALQCRYPAQAGVLSTGISDVHIPNEVIVMKPRLFNEEKRTFKLIFVGSLAQLYKAPDVLIDAISICVKSGLDINLTILGDGKYLKLLEEKAANLNIQDKIHFLGSLPAGAAVLKELDKADLFVLPSHTEGLPKAMVEAMARALPCIGSSVGGIPELISPTELIPPGDIGALAAKIREVITDPQRMTDMSVKNLEKAKEYRSELLLVKRIEFYRYIREKTEELLKQII
jgi:glycosyltransferase involved in cell wall biosynthesis